MLILTFGEVYVCSLELQLIHQMGSAENADTPKTAMLSLEILLLVKNVCCPCGNIVVAYSAM